MVAVPTPTHPSGQITLIERERQLEALTLLFQSACDGRGAVAFVSGEAGAGKTALIRAFLEHASSARVLTGFCDGVSTPRPLGPLHDFAAEVPEIAELLTQKGAIRQRVFDTLLNALGRQTPTVLVIEDIHWSDNATLDVLRWVGRRLDGTGALLIATYREDEAGVFDPLRMVIGDMATLPWTHHIPLPPLTSAGVAQLAANTELDIVALHRLTGGNPFYVNEALATVDGDGVPRTIRDAVRARVARLSPRARSALDAAAVLGSRAETWLVAGVTGEDVLGIDECLTAGLLIREDSSVAFRHELTRLTVLEDLPMIRGVGLHRRALHFLEEASSGDPARLAYHAEGAADAAAVRRYAPQAAAAARALLAHTEALAQFRRTLRFGDGLADDERASILETMSHELYLTNHLQEAYDARIEAIRLREAAGDAVLAAVDRRYLSRVAWFLGRSAEAWENAHLAVQALEAVEPSRELAMAWGNVGHLHTIDRNLEQALIWGHRALELGRRLDDTEVIAYTLNNIGAAELEGGIEAGRAKLEESLRIAKLHNMQEHIDRALFNMGEADAVHHRYQEAEQYFLACLEYTASCDLERCQLLSDSGRAWIRLETGRWAEADEMARALLAHPRVSEHARVAAMSILAVSSARRGSDEHDALLDHAAAIAHEAGGTTHLGNVASAAAEAAWLRDDSVAVARVTADAFALAAERHDSWTAGDLAAWQWRAGLIDHPPSGVAEPYALEMEGSSAEAAAAWEERGNPYRAALARMSSSDPTDLRAAHAAFLQLGATATADVAARRLRKLGAPVPRGPRSATRAHTAGLTERESEIAELVAGGLTNREIADRLVLSEKTVGHHVSAVLGKLGVHRRTNVARVLAQGQAATR